MATWPKKCGSFDRLIRRFETNEDVNFATKKNTSNFVEINPQFMNGNFAKELSNFVNVNFLKYPLNFNEINMHFIDGNY